MATKKGAAKKPAAKKARELEQAYPLKDFINKLQRLADSLEKKKRFSIQLSGERVYVPSGAIVDIVHEKKKGTEEIDFQIKWAAK